MVLLHKHSRSSGFFRHKADDRMREIPSREVAPDWLMEKYLRSSETEPQRQFASLW